MRYFLLFLTLLYCVCCAKKDPTKAAQFSAATILQVINDDFEKKTEESGLDIYEQEPVAEEKDDPNSGMEKYNRFMFNFNMAFDRYVFQHLAHAFGYIPEDIRGAFYNFYKNINQTSPRLFYSVVQLDLESFSAIWWRFMINSTLGTLGLFDVASQFGLRPIEKSPDQTLRLFGFSPGKYFVLPVIGANTTSNSLEFPILFLFSLYNPYFPAFGFGNDYSLPFWFMGPTFPNYVATNYFGAIYLPAVFQARLKYDVLISGIQENSVDGYSTLKNFYLSSKKYDEDIEIDLMKYGRFAKESPVALSHMSRANDIDGYQEADDSIEYNIELR